MRIKDIELHQKKMQKCINKFYEIIIHCKHPYSKKAKKFIKQQDENTQVILKNIQKDLQEKKILKHVKCNQNRIKKYNKKSSFSQKYLHFNFIMTFFRSLKKRISIFKRK